MPEKSKTRTRSRNMEVGEGQKVISAELKKQARVVFEENGEMNTHKREHDKARKALYKGMKDTGVTGFTITVNGSKVRADVVQPDLAIVDIVKLRSLVTEEQFLKMATVSQSVVTKFVGTDILNQCLVVTPKGGTENVKVKAG